MGLSLMVTSIALLAFLLGVGRSLREWSAIPWNLGWLMIAALPIGGLLAAIDERLLEVPLLAVSLTWVVLGLRLAALAEPVSGAKADVRP